MFMTNHERDEVHQALQTNESGLKKRDSKMIGVMSLLLPYLFWHSTLGRRGTTLHTGRWCTCSRWWGCNQDHSKTLPPSRGCNARKAAGGRCSLHDSPLEVVDKLGQIKKEERRKTLLPAAHCWVASVCQNAQGTRQAALEVPCSFGFVSVVPDRCCWEVTFGSHQHQEALLSPHCLKGWEMGSGKPPVLWGRRGPEEGKRGHLCL